MTRMIGKVLYKSLNRADVEIDEIEDDSMGVEDQMMNDVQEPLQHYCFQSEKEKI